MKRKAAWRSPLWFDLPVGRIRFLRELVGVPDARQVKHSVYAGGFSVAMTVKPLGVPERQVTLSFSRIRPTDPMVTADGPTDSPHRYSDGTLCMWYPSDPPEKRWALADGAAALVANVTAHLVREEWYRATGEWLGDEVRHGPSDPNNDPDPQGAVTLDGHEQFGRGETTVVSPSVETPPLNGGLDGEPSVARKGEQRWLAS